MRNKRKKHPSSYGYSFFGKVVKYLMECINYYGGKLSGISSLFRASDVIQSELSLKINTMFTSDDIPGYKLFKTNDCEMCKNAQKLDAIISSEGYTNIS